MWFYKFLLVYLIFIFSLTLFLIKKKKNVMLVAIILMNI